MEDLENQIDDQGEVSISEEEWLQETEQTEQGVNQEEKVEQVEEQEIEQEETENEETVQEKLYKESDFNNLRSQKDKEIAKAQKELEAWKKLVDPLREDIVFDEHGNPRGFNLKPKEETQKQDIPQKPSAEERDLDPDAYYDKLEAWLEYKAEQRVLKAIEAKEAESEKRLAQRNFEQQRQSFDQKTLKEFPDFSNQESELFKRGQQIANEMPELLNRPDGNYRITRMAYLELQAEKAKVTQKTKDKTVIINSKQSKGGSKASNDSLSDDDFANLDPEKQFELMEADFF